MAHSHNHSHREVSGKNLLFTMVLNFIITAGQIVAGFISGSLALMSDAFHNLADGMASVNSYIALKLSRRENTLEKTFGYKRAEVIAAVINSAVLVIITFFLFKEAVQRWFDPQPVKTGIMLIAAAIGLVANTFSVFLLKKDAEHNLNIRSAYVHLSMDALASLAVIVGGVLMSIWEVYWIDPVLTLIIGLYVLKESFAILKEGFDIIMISTPKGIDILEIQKMLEELPEVENIHHVHVWQLNDREVYLEAHVDLNENWTISETDLIRLRIEKILRENFNIQHITLQMEYQICESKEVIRKRRNINVNEGER
jgi:cobalt-zinc-cadmium efflux system protein